MDALWHPIADAVMRPVFGDLTTDLDHIRGLGGLVGRVVRRQGPAHAARTIGCKGQFNLRYCGNGSLDACRASLWAAVDQVAASLAAAAGPGPDGVAEHGSAHRLHARADPRHDARHEPPDVPAGARVRRVARLLARLGPPPEATQAVEKERPLMKSVRHILGIGVILVLAASCTRAQIHTTVLASDTFAGRNNGTAGSIASQNYLIAQLRYMGAVGLDASAAGDNAFKQQFPAGTNILGLIRGEELPNEYVMVGGHYDHLGSSCEGTSAADSICNGATDNATGSAATLEVARALAETEGGPRRSVIVALWDREEDGLLGSEYYAQNPIVPIADTIAYVNFDIQGANLLPSLRTTSFAVGAETGGTRLADRGAGRDRIDPRDPPRELDLRSGPERLRELHRGRRPERVLQRLDRALLPHRRRRGRNRRLGQARQADRHRDARSPGTSLPARARRSSPPHRSRPSPTRSSSASSSTRPSSDLGRFTPSEQAQLTAFRDQLNLVISQGPGAFDDTDIPPLLAGAVTAVLLLTSGPCDGFLAP